MEPVQSWAGLGRTEAANIDTKTCLKEPAQVSLSFLPQLIALFPHNPRAAGQHLPCELLTYSAPWLCTACLGRPEPGQAQVGGTRGPPTVSSSSPTAPLSWYKCN